MNERYRKMPEFQHAASVYCRALGNPTAYWLLRLIGSGVKTPTDLAAAMEVSQPLVSSTLKSLRDVNLVRCQTRGQRREYSVCHRKLLDALDSLEKLIAQSRAGKA